MTVYYTLIVCFLRERSRVCGSREACDFERMRNLTLAGLLAGVAVFGGIGCLTAEGGIGDPVVSDDPPSQISKDDTGSPSTSDDTGSATSDDDTGSPSTSDDTGSASASDTGSTSSDTSIPDTSMADTAKPDTSVADTSVADTAKPDTAPVDTGTVVTDTGTSGDWPAAYATLEQGILAETNKRRAAGASCGTKGTFGPAGPLVMQSQLQTAARKHSKDMATNNYFSHTNLAGKSPFDRMKAEGYKGGTMGENIAAGNATVAATMDQWMKSDGHCANIMNKSYTQLGVGYWYSATSTYKHYWTQNFGAGG